MSCGLLDVEALLCGDRKTLPLEERVRRLLNVEFLRNNFVRVFVLEFVDEAVDVSLGNVVPVVGVAALRGGALEHVLLVAHAILRPLELPGEGGGVLELVQAAVIRGVADGAGVGRRAVGGQRGVRLDLVLVLDGAVGPKMLLALAGPSAEVLVPPERGRVLEVLAVPRRGVGAKRPQGALQLVVQRVQILHVPARQDRPPSALEVEVTGI